MLKILHYTRGITPKRVTSGEIHLRGLAPGQRSSEETSQRWRAVATLFSIWLTRGSNPKPTASMLELRRQAAGF